MKGFTEKWLRENYKDADLVLARGHSVELKCGPPPGTQPGSWTVVIPGWIPANKNLKARGPWKWHRARKRDNTVIATALVLAGVPPAWGKRRVSLAAEKQNARNLPDPQNLEESFFDSLECGKFLIKDSPEWMESPRATIVVNRDMDCPVRSTVVITDI